MIPVLTSNFATVFGNIGIADGKNFPQMILLATISFHLTIRRMTGAAFSRASETFLERKQKCLLAS